MKKEYIAICDPDAGYAGNLAAFLNRRNTLPCEAAAFTETKSLVKMAGSGSIPVMLISPAMLTDEVKALKTTCRIILLGDDERREDAGGFDQIYRYQPGDSLASKLENFCGRKKSYAEDAGEKAAQIVDNIPAQRDNPQTAPMRMEVIGIYSPVGRCGKTCFGMTLAALLSERKKVCFLNLENYSGLEGIFRGYAEDRDKGDLADLIYLLRRDGEIRIEEYNRILCTWKKMDYIRPVFSPEDIRDIEAQEWRSLLEALDRIGSVDVVILDIGDQIKEVQELLSLCDEIYIPIREDRFSMAKFHQFEKTLSGLEHPQIAERMEALVLPEISDEELKGSFPEGIIHGKMGAYVRSLLRKRERV